METTVLVALIAGLSSLLVAFVSLASAWRNSNVTRKNCEATNKNAQTLEWLQFHLENVNKKNETSDQELSNILDKLKIALRSIQRVKDEILIIKYSQGDSLTKEEALANLREARAELFKSYEDDFSLFEQSEDRHYHTAKNITLEVEKILSTAFETKRYASELPAEVLRRISDSHDRLTDCQRVLRDNRDDRIFRRATNG